MLKKNAEYGERQRERKRAGGGGIERVIHTHDEIRYDEMKGDEIKII